MHTTVSGALEVDLAYRVIAKEQGVRREDVTYGQLAAQLEANRKNLRAAKIVVADDRTEVEPEEDEELAQLGDEQRAVVADEHAERIAALAAEEGRALDSLTADEYLAYSDRATAEGVPYYEFYK